MIDGGLAAAWDDLADRTGAAPFARPGWLRPWAEATGVRLEALTAYCGDCLLGVLPVVWDRHRVRTPADWHSPWFEAVVADGTPLRALAAALAGAARSRVTVDFVLAGEGTARAAADALNAAGYRLRPRVRQESPFVAVHGSWEHYLASLPARRRSDLRRRARRLEEAGTVTWEVHEEAKGLPRLLEEALAVEAAGWKGAAGTAIASHPAMARFYREVAIWAAERGWLRLALLRLDGRALAFDLALEAQGRHFLLKTGYDPAFNALSPGLLLRRHMLQRAFDLSLASYEFCGAAEPWKLEWAQATRPVLAIEAFAPTLGGSLARAAARAARWARVHLSRRRERS
ncbi:MAG: GNAT family N-acetyltransferase [Acidimicrobiia bacterium]|nr:GNAT family N-acetyltransferase [Acidimicrobiia bacterium]